MLRARRTAPQGHSSARPSPDEILAKACAPADSWFAIITCFSVRAETFVNSYVMWYLRSSMDYDTIIGGPQQRFPVTSHSAIIAARSDDPNLRERALETIIASYWKP